MGFWSEESWVAALRVPALETDQVVVVVFADETSVDDWVKSVNTVLPDRLPGLDAAGRSGVVELVHVVVLDHLALRLGHSQGFPEELLSAYDCVGEEAAEKYSAYTAIPDLALLG